jgi:hypothetical protein
MRFTTISLIGQTYFLRAFDWLAKMIFSHAKISYFLREFKYDFSQWPKTLYNTYVYIIINNYSLKARWLSGNIRRDEVEVNIPRYSPSLRRIIVLVFLHKFFCVFLVWIHFSFAYFFITNFNKTASRYFENFEFDFVIFTCRWI